MKKILLAISVLTVTLFMLGSQTSCKKENVTNVTNTDTVLKCIPTLPGLWIGTQQNTSTSQPFAMSLKPDGTMTYENIISGTRQFCAGTWTLVNTTFTGNTTCIYGVAGNVGVQQTFTAVYNSSTGTLTNGAYVNLPPSGGSGTFTITEAN